MAKQYGLILPGKQQKSNTFKTPSAAVSKPSIFDENSESTDEDSNAPQSLKKKTTAMGPGAMERRIARNIQEKALSEDPTIFQYDELYDEMENKKQQESSKSQSKDLKKPKYIARLLETASRRKIENDLRFERQVQKERELEGEQFKDKEKFVTSTYRKKLEEMRKMEEQEKRDEYLEAIGDVTKQKDLDGFYRHLYEQKLGTEKEVKKPDIASSAASDGADVGYKPIKSGKPQQRAYRKRHSSEDEEDETIANEAKKAHIPNNIDADSDFSIDSSSSSEEDEEVENGKLNKENHKDNANNKDNTQKEEMSKIEQMDATTVALNFNNLKKDDENERNSNEPSNGNDKEKQDDVQVVIKEECKEDVDVLPKPKRDKSEIWKKRTVGEVFDEAVKRYFERKAARSA